MKTCLLIATLVAAGTLALPATVQARPKAVSLPEFRTNVSLLVATRSNNAAINAVANLLRRSLPTAPARIVPFNSIANNGLRHAIRANLRSRAVVKLAQTLGLSYFRGKVRYNPNDRRFLLSIRQLVRSLPASQRTTPVLNQIVASLTRLNQIKHGSAEDLQALVAFVYAAAGLPAPPPVS